MRFFMVIGASLLMVGCATWDTLTTDDMLADARERSAQTSAEHILADWQGETFGVLADLAGQTLRAVPVDEDGNPIEGAPADVQRWEWSLDGKQIVTTHALEDGSYGGVTHTYATGDKLEFQYVTNAGFETHGTVELLGAYGWEVLETVEGHASITQIRSAGQLRSDGAIVVEAYHMSNGDWERSHGFVYTPYDGKVPQLKKPVKK